MKIKTFILTLLLMSCPFLFGQHWTPTQPEGAESTMSAFVNVTIADVAKEADIEVGAFFGNICCVSKVVKNGTLDYLNITKPGSATTNTISFKLYANDKEYILNETLEFAADTQVGNFDAPKVLATDAVAETNDLIYETLADAIAAAQAGSTVTLLKDIESSEIITLNKAITLDLNGKVVTSTAKKAFEVYADATITSTATNAGKIIGANRCVDTRKAVNLTLTDVTLVADKYTTAYENPQPLTIGGSEDGTTVNMTNVNISAAEGYGIITFVKTNLTATNSTIGGYNALYVKQGSEESTFNFVKSTLNSNIGNDVEGNSFATIVTEANDIVVNMDKDSQLNAVGNNQSAIAVGTENYRGIKDCEITIAGTITGNILSTDNASENIIKVKAEYADELNTAGFATSTPVNGLVTVLGTAVAKITNINTNTTTYYATLSAAISAANAGNNTITFLADINENVTLNKSLTIDGGQDTKFNYTGKMTATTQDITVTIRNVDFVNAGFDKPNQSYYGSYTFSNCTFDGEGTYAYPIRAYGAYTIKVESCTVKNYQYSFLYIPSATTTVNVKDVTVENCPSYAVYFASGVNNAYFEGLTVKNSNNGFVINNTANRALTLKGCKFENVTNVISHTGGTNAITCTLNNGINNFGDAVSSQYAKYVLAETDATLTAPEGLDVTTNVAEYVVKYDGVKYFLIGAAAAVKANGKDPQYYETFAAALTAAQAGETITLLKDIEASDIITLDKAITLDGNGKTLTSTSDGEYGRAINVDYNGNVNISNLTIATTKNTERAINVIQKAANLTLTNVTAEGFKYTINVASSSVGSTINTIGGKFSGYAAVNITGSKTKFTSTNTEFIGINNASLHESNNYGVIVVNAAPTENVNVNINGGTVKAETTVNRQFIVDAENATNANITINADLVLANGDVLNTTIENGLVVKVKADYVDELNAQGYATTSIDQETGLVTVLGKAVAKITNTNTYYATLSAAINAATNGQTITLLTDIEASDIITLNKAITLDLNGKVVTSTAKKAFEVYADATITSTATNAGKIIGANRCVDTRKAVNLTLSNVNLVADNYTSYGNPQPLTIGGEDDGTKVNMTNVNISAAEGYGIITFVETELTAKNSTIGGYSALYVKPGSENSTFNFVNSTLSGSTPSGNDVVGNSFSTIAVRANNVTVNADAASTVNATGNHCYALSFGSSYAGEESCSDNDVTIAGTINGKILPKLVGQNNVVTVNADYADELNTAGFATSTPVNGLVTVLGKAVAKVNETLYTTLEAAFAAAKNNETVTMLADVELATSDSNGAFEIAVGRKLTLDLNGKNITAGARTGYTGRTQYAFDNYADLTITGKGTITSRGIQNYGTLTINSADVKVIACDTNGGACVWGYAGSITNISAGTFENNGTTTGMTSGIINTEGKLHVTGGTFTQSGNGATYAIICNDEATFSNAIITGIHGVIAAVGNANVTIENGTYTLIGVTGQSDHNIYTSDNAKVTINGGTFTCNEKDAGGKTLNGTTTSIVATGGSFDEDVEEYCAEGFGSVKSAENVWMVKPAQTRTLNTGWSWYSHYVVAPEYESVLTQLQNEIGNNGIQIKAATDNEGYLQYDNGNGWFGDLRTTSPAKMYKIKVTEGQDVKVVGDIVDPELCKISLVGGDKWNWIGFPIAIEEGINIKAALSGIQAKDNDIIKSQDEFAQYSATADKWYGSLKSLQPGQGYMYDRKGANTEFTFAYPTSKTSVEANITTENNYWVPVDQYANNMTMIATLDIENENYELAAFVNGEVRGSARPIYVDAFDAYMFFLTIHGDNVEEVSFMCYDLNTNTEFSLNERINYSNDAILGSIEEPYALRGTVGMGEVSANTIAVYPNPTTTGNDINLATTCDKVEVFNALGVKVAEYQNVDTIDALEAAGIYVIRITNNDNVQNCRLVVK